MEVKLLLEGQKKLLTTLSLLARQTKDTRSLMAKLAILGFKDIMAHFKAESGPNGRWQSLSQKRFESRYDGGKKGRRSIKRRPKILQDTGRLRASIQPLVESPRRAVLAATNVIYAATHQFGRGHIPARPFMWLSRKTKDDMLEMARKHIKGRSI